MIERLTLKNKKIVNEKTHSLNTLINDTAEEAQLIQLIYRFATKKEEWFNLLLSLSNCISVSEALPANHPYQDISVRLIAHLKNAIKISTRLSSSSKHIKSESVLNNIPMAAGIIDRTGRMVETNKLAQDRIRHASNWNVNQGYLQASHIDLEKTLNALKLCGKGFITVPFDSNSFNPSSSNATTDIKKKHLSLNKVHITQIPKQDNTASEHYYFCLQTEHTELVNINLLTTHYQLTETEALVVSTLANEISIKKTAIKLKLKETTIRDHLSNIYIKLDVKRKPELIRKVLLHSLLSNQAPLSSTARKISLVTPNLAGTKFITLQDGRKLSYLDYQSPSKNKVSDNTQPVILVLHNVMGSAFEIPPDSDQVIRDHGLRIIIPERPGYGDSDPKPTRNHQDFCQDIKTLLNTLKIDKVNVIAHSIGGAYALALAEFLPDRIVRIAMVNAVARLEDMRQAKPVPLLINAVLQSIRFAPFLMELILKMMIGKDIEEFYEQQLTYIRPTVEGRAADINLLSRRNYREYSILNLKQSVKQGVSTWADELTLSFSEWDFKVTNTKIEYQFWHGDQDDVISIHAAKRLAHHVNTIKFNHIKNETHFLFSRHFNQVVAQLVGAKSITKESNTKLAETFV
jgi:pimeloyl-ACP methyl ester carboxylesterase/DNA-binding CsgD family transcriptional regulator